MFGEFLGRRNVELNLHPSATRLHPEDCGAIDAAILPHSRAVHWKQSNPSRLPRHVGEDTSFDPKAAAIDRLDAYRAGDPDTILAMYAEHAIISRGCDVMKTITRPEGIRLWPS
jgi:hypothetical protein